MDGDSTGTGRDWGRVERTRGEWRGLDRNGMGMEGEWRDLERNEGMGGGDWKVLEGTGGTRGDRGGSDKSRGDCRRVEKTGCEWRGLERSEGG